MDGDIDMVSDPALREYNASPARQFLPDSIRSELPALEAVENASRSAGLMVYARFFTPTGPEWEWLVLGGSERGEDFRFFGFVRSPKCPTGEFGSFGLGELRRVHLGFHLGIERDEHFEPCFFLELPAQPG